MDIECLLDDLIVQEAVRLAEEFIQSYPEFQSEKDREWPISRSQLSGLVHIARNEPEKLVEFAEHQAEKAVRSGSARGRFGTTEPDNPKERFWKLIKEIVQGDTKGKRWSLEKVRRECIPSNLLLESAETPQAKKEREVKLREWEKQWNREVFPVFFRTFVSHLLYRAGRGGLGGSRRSKGR
jgi:hypothetical protein